MFYIEKYTRGELKKTLRQAKASGVSLSSDYFLLILFHDLHKNLIDYLSDQWTRLHRASGEFLHLLSPIRPPGETSGPINPLAEKDSERSALLRDLAEAEVEISELPMLLVFTVEETDSITAVNVLGTLSLRPVEESANPAKEFNRIFSTLVTEAISCYIKDISPERFSKRVNRRFTRMKLQEKLADYPAAQEILKVILHLVPRPDAQASSS